MSSDCVRNEDCPAGKVCDGIVFSSCKPGCRDDAECTTGKICVAFSGPALFDVSLPKCVPGCLTNAECRAGQFCPTGSACTDHICDTGKGPLPCVTGCRDDSECAIGLVCRVGKCEPGCRDDSECGVGGVCRANKCEAGCRDDRGCSIGETCTFGMCRARPTTAASCIPTSLMCYSDPTKGAASPGAECLATQDNTGSDHIQLRQQWTRALTPAGTASGLIYAILAGRTQLPWKMCNQTGGIGSGGHIQLVDFFFGGDTSTHYSIAGYATFVPGPATEGDPTFTPSVVQEGFCYGQEDYAGTPPTNGIDYGLAATEVGGGTDFPPGLEKPMALKTGLWKVRPMRSKRIDADFDIGGDAGRTPAQEATRKDLLAKLADSGEYGSAGFGGVFYFDDATGTVHGFGALGWVVWYDAAGVTHIAIPLREVETRSTFNGRDARNCIGAYRPEALDPTTCVAGQDPTQPGWGGSDCTATTGFPLCAPGESAASTKGYFLVAELEQIYSKELQSTLCVAFPGYDTATSQPIVQGQGFYDATRKGCLTSKWNPSLPDGSGLPNGDWCAATNAPATATCHDAWRSISFHAYAGAKIQLDSTGTPAMCAF